MPWIRYDPSMYGNKKQKQKRQEPPIKTACVRTTGGIASDCVNTPVEITALSTGAVAKIPVVLAELTLQLNVNAVIDLPESAWEIKRIKKHVKVTQCLLIQDTNMLFIKGFVRKNIDYTTHCCSNSQGSCGDIKQCTVDVPFSCTTALVFNGIDPLPPVPSISTEFEYFRKQELNDLGFADKDKLLSGDLSEFNQTSTEFFNELPFCDLVSARIVEFDEFLNPTHPTGGKIPFAEKFFESIEEKMIIFLTLKIMQNRQVAIPPISIVPVCSDYEQC
ncbi:hypothetical protein HNQ80_002864 [Anaerosolibacter carboniphilus]|uniref:DUF3794 domain-containing protein n=1 Tax=Anaerosolibacter carboniphilus TaxID=1417629 RepID=A0A841KXN6_9FIRM|nr:hypothetical protein [Anaerosolibacter carboniphilus]MBB6216760.1 hypothetical protein [Anaerosolibacter carboniphilus]